MKKLIALLSIAFLIIFILGMKNMNKEEYSKDQIKSFNQAAAQTLADLEEKSNQIESSISQAAVQKPDAKELSGYPEITPLYPASLENNSTTEANKVILKFTDDSEVVSATLNGRKVALTGITVTTVGTYHVTVADNEENENLFTFTIK
ncbi:MAG: hypothetical protein HGA49_00995 [Eubacteriaceae bacterium]|nr:hypothetical protein [Eubacteriaceae bacterium]